MCLESLPKLIRRKKARKRTKITNPKLKGNKKHIEHYLKAKIGYRDKVLQAILCYTILY